MRPEDSEIFAHVACLVDLEDTIVANMTEPETFQEDDVDPQWSHDVKIRKASERNVELRASTSMDSLRSYEDIKAEKHFLSQLNNRYINKMPFTRILRLGTNSCCHFQEESR